MSRQTGSRYERELVTFFREAGWGAIRLGASGSGGDADLPDVLAGRRTPVPGRGVYTDAIAIELKSGKATTLYVQEDEVTALEGFASAWGATPLLGARPTTQATGREHFLLRPEDARMTDGGAYGLPVESLVDRAFAVVGPEGVGVR